MKKTVLVIDDFETTLYTVGMTLETKGYIVVKANSAIEALKLLDGRTLNLIISDFNMPEMNGVEFTREVRKNATYKNVPVLMLTTETSPEKKKEAMDSGITGWIKKPYQFDEFQKIVTRVIR